MNIHNAIIKLNPLVVNIVGEDAFDKDGNPVDYDLVAAQAYAESQSYVELRAREYPSVADQLDTIFHGGIEMWKAQIQAVKDKYPKPEQESA